jgi:hypothetical protein
MWDRCRAARVRAGFIFTCLSFAVRLHAQTPDSAFFVMMQGRDTVAIEQYVRTGNTITGSWIQHTGSVFIHDYSLVLGDDGWPRQYVMTVYTARPHTFLLSVTYGADSATRIIVRDGVATTDRVAAQHGYPVGALSILGMQLALERARRAHTDSTTILLDRAEVRGPSKPLPVRFLGGDSARVGGDIEARVDQEGRLLMLREGPRVTRRVPSLAVGKLIAGFVTADSLARAARVAITLPASALQRFVGEYSLGPNAVAAVTLDGDKLLLRVANQPSSRLLPMAPATFFMEDALGLTFEFESDANGNVTALSVVQGVARQRAVKTK